MKHAHRPNAALAAALATALATVSLLTASAGARAQTATPRDAAGRTAQPAATALAAVQALQSRLPGPLWPHASELLRTLAKLSRQRPPLESGSVPEQTRGDPAQLAVVLPETLAFLDEFLPRAPTALRGALLTAREGFTLAQQRLNDGARDNSAAYLVAVLQAMAQGQAGIGQALDIAASTDPGAMALLVPAIQKARGAAERASQRLIDLALAAGVDAGRLVPASVAMREGDAAHDAGAFAVAIGHYAKALGFAANTVAFSIDRMELNLRSAFDNNSIGYAYALSQSGQLARSGANGVARTGADAPATLQSATRKMHVASVSKTLTAVVTLRLLAEKGLTPDSKIGPWLPASWARGDKVNSISFRDLMTHRSGFGQNQPVGSSYANLQAMVAQAVPLKDNFKYDNANFGLLRVLAAKLQGVDVSQVPLFEPGALSAALHQVRATQIFAAIDVPYTCTPAVQNPTLGYTFPNNGQAGYSDGPMALSCGGFGVFMSAQELARTMAYLRYTQDLVDSASFQKMKAGFLGFMNPAKYAFAAGAFGTYFGHGGDWDGANSGGLDTCVMMFPIAVEAALVINSSGTRSGAVYPQGPYQCTTLKWAFENAWVAQ